MSEWWTYTLSDLQIFSARTYARLFETYNAAVWPAHVLALALGLLLDYSDITRDTTISRAVGETAKRLFATDTDCASASAKKSRLDSVWTPNAKPKP